MLVYNESLVPALTNALQLSYRLQEDLAIDTDQLLEKQLMYLSMYASHTYIDNCIVVLGYDFSAFSFSVLWFLKGKDAYPQVTLDDIQNGIDERGKYLSIGDLLECYGYKFWMNGGLLYHGTHDRGGDGGAPTFSVNLLPVNGWSIHT